MSEIETLIKQCMDTGWFKSEETARNYVMKYCIAKKVEDEHIAEGEEIFDDPNADKGYVSRLEDLE